MILALGTTPLTIVCTLLTRKLKAHTNAVEGTWPHAKPSLPTERRERQHFFGYLAKFTLWRRKKAREKTDRFQSFANAVATLSSPNANRNFPYSAEEDEFDDPVDSE